MSKIYLSRCFVQAYDFVDGMFEMSDQQSPEDLNPKPLTRNAYIHPRRSADTVSESQSLKRVSEACRDAKLRV